MKKYRLALVGATGLVGRTVIKVLEEKKLPIDKYCFFSSSKSSGSKIIFLGSEYIVKELKEDSFDEGFDYAIFCAGGSVSKKYAKIAVNKNVPLVVPEVNFEDALNNRGIIANPNCSTIQAVVALKPLDDKYKIKRIIYSTYQAVSGAGQKGIEDFERTSKGLSNQKFTYPIYNNCIPHIDDFLDDGYTKEEMKMINETKKILHNKRIKVTATTVRVPVLNSHSESINVEFKNEIDIDEIKKLLSCSPGIILEDDINNNKYPLASNSSGSDYVYVGRIRRDYTVKNGINMWVVADNIRKGAASNAVQILERLIK